MTKEQLVNLVLSQKSILVNPGSKPKVADIKQKAQDLWNFVNNPSTEPEVGLIAVVAPDPNLIDQYFKGWKVDNFERLALEISNLEII